MADLAKLSRCDLFGDARLKLTFKCLVNSQHKLKVGLLSSCQTASRKLHYRWFCLKRYLRFTISSLLVLLVDHYISQVIVYLTLRKSLPHSPLLLLLELLREKGCRFLIQSFPAAL